ncbi:MULTISPECIES: histidine kinase dimerization/phospho-acceptor domain-containing protein [Bacillaceae]|uniref:histidine kinase dimerization/phospho-acceptor domain-containing protein n=1 Tax=Bacillaceae TaxID=186817 RepID=UPI001CCCEB28|nr:MULTISPECIES: histidine kinase dimerization/phospho-acceptor domain-containing protein [Bacillaceae]UTI44055.1 hypothetical protein NKG37_10685 [Niallia sp. RD1]
MSEYILRTNKLTKKYKDDFALENVNVSIIIAVLLLTRLFALKKEVKKISKQLEKYNDRKTNKKIEMALFDKNMEKLGLEINKLIDLYVAENRKRIRYENEQKQAIANMSHDLRTPLTSILGYIQMAEEEDVTEDERKEIYISDIRKTSPEKLKTVLRYKVIEI